MKTNTYSASIPLRQLVNDLLCKTSDIASRNSTEVQNEITENILLRGMNEKMVILLYQVMFAVISNSRYGDIHIQSERFRDHVDLRITDKSNYNGYSLSFSIGAIKPDASKLGADLLLMNHQQKEATVIFSLPETFAA